MIKDIKICALCLILACAAFAFGFDHGRLNQIDRVLPDMQCTLKSLSPMPSIKDLR